MSELIQMLPVVALRGMTVLPDMVIHFDVSRERSVHAIEQAMLREQRLFLVTQKNTQTENPGFEDLYRIGTIASVKQVIKLPHNILRVLAEGLERGELSHLDLEGDYPEAEVIPVDTLAATGGIGLLVEKAIENRKDGMSIRENLETAAKELYALKEVQNL